MHVGCWLGVLSAWQALCKVVQALIGSWGVYVLGKHVVRAAHPLLVLHGLLVFILRSLMRFLPTSLVWAQIDREARDVGA